MRPWLLAALSLGTLGGCERNIQLDEGGLEPAIAVINEAQERAPVGLEVAAETIQGRPSARGKADAGDPEGYVRMTPMARSGGFGHAVILVDPSQERLVPIFIGGTEALSIQLRLEHQKFTRPLTHDLLDAVMKELGAKMIRAQVDALEGGVYLGTVVVLREGEVITFDARPSDAIALAIGNAVPIFVSERVLEEAAEGPEDFDRTKSKPRPDPVAL